MIDPIQIKIYFIIMMLGLILLVFTLVIFYTMLRSQKESIDNINNLVMCLNNARKNVENTMRGKNDR